MSKLISLDLDGTLLNSEKKVSDRNLEALYAYKKQGGQIVFATARPLRVVLPLLPSTLHNEYMICYNGGEIYKNKEKIEENVIEAEEVRRIVREFHQNFPNRFIGIEAFETFFTNRELLPIFKGEQHEYFDIDTFEYNSSPKILLHMEGIGREKVEEILGERYTLTISDKGVLGQIGLSGVNKLRGLQKVLNMNNLTLKDAVAFGDDYNDYEIIKGVGKGIAMGNAEEDIKSIADFVTKSNNEDGVAYYLETQIGII